MSEKTQDPFAVPGWIDRLGASVEHHPGLWKRLGNLETSMLDEHVEHIAIEAPIYVCGLARSGSTILLEILAEHADTASHAYRDFPLVYTPVFWNRFLDRAQSRPAAAVERAHGDGIEVTPDSPEAVEEVLWAGFFPHLHRPGVSDVLSAVHEAPAFERFYREHLRKLLWLRGGRRYLAKGNYNTTRIDFLLRLFPDARFIVPIREPVAHFASLVRQHLRFSERHREDPRARRYMRRLGHFEFGLDRRAVHTGDERAAERIREAWAAGRDAEGYARSWSDVYRYVADRLDASPSLREAVLVVRHEVLCTRPEETLRRIFEHCRLPYDDATIARASAHVRRQPGLPAANDDAGAEAEEVRRLTAATAARFGYPAEAARHEALRIEALYA
ncbi:MAG: sulfotransferase [Gammaproteobacteria bacterium]